MTGEAPTAPEPTGWRSLLAPGIAALAVLAILLGLGTWQLQRLVWKQDLLTRIGERARAAPVPIPPEAEWPRWSADADEFRHVRLAGTYLYDRQVLVHGLAPGDRQGAPLQGFYVLTPMRLAAGETVVVNRGFLPTELKESATPPGGEAAATVTGLLRASEVRTMFVPENRPARGEWFTRDLPAVTAAQGLARVAPFLVEADAGPRPGGWPRGGQLRLDLPNNHLQYAFTWFGIALCLVGVFGAFAWRRLRPAGPALAEGPPDARSGMSASPR